MADWSKRHLKRVLRECAESGVPEKATSPWPEIRERLGERGTVEARASAVRTNEGTVADVPNARRPPLIPDRPLGWALAVLSVLILGLGVYAASGPVRELFGGGPIDPGSPGTGSPRTDNAVGGTPERDRMDGGGDDTVRALAGNDTVFDTEGRNVAYGGDGDDWITISGSGYGGPGDDTIDVVFGEGKGVGGPGADLILVHNDERDTVSCGTGRDTVYLDKELDSLATDCERQIPREYDVPGDVPFSGG